MKVQLVAKPVAGMNGTSRYASNLFRGLQTAGVDVSVAVPEPFPPWATMRQGLRRVGVDAEAFFGSYPVVVGRKCADIYHLTTQTMGTLLLTQRFEQPVVVTVLDIIPFLVRKNPELRSFRNPIDALCYKLALLGLRRADAIIAISHWTQKTLIEVLGLPATKIHMVYPAVDNALFRRLPVPESFFRRYQLSRENHYILYVGSDDPRKNLKTLIEAMALVKARVASARLLMVGSPQFESERSDLTRLIDRLGLSRDVSHFSAVADGDLALFYNAADVCVMPSRFEGFGLPVMEAMYCGTPVIVADAASLPEIVGDSGKVVAPDDIRGWCAAIVDTVAKDSPARPLSANRPRNYFQLTGQLAQSSAMINVYQQLIAAS